MGVFNADDLRTIFALAGSAEEKCARDAAITLGNLAVVTRNQQAITDVGGLAPLVAMLSGNPYVSCQKFAARALYRLAAHGDNKPRIVEGGALPPLVRRLRSPDAEVARYEGVHCRCGVQLRCVMLRSASVTGMVGKLLSFGTGIVGERFRFLSKAFFV